MKQQFGNSFRAWRSALDLDGSMNLQRSELFKAVKAMNWKGNIRALWCLGPLNASLGWVSGRGRPWTTTRAASPPSKSRCGTMWGPWRRSEVRPRRGPCHGALQGVGRGLCGELQAAQRGLRGHRPLQAQEALPWPVCPGE